MLAAASSDILFFKGWLCLLGTLSRVREGYFNNALRLRGERSRAVLQACHGVLCLLAGLLCSKESS
jgi:hypothetical protein